MFEICQLLPIHVWMMSSLLSIGIFVECNLRFSGVTHHTCVIRNTLQNIIGVSAFDYQSIDTKCLEGTLCICSEVDC